MKYLLFLLPIFLYGCSLTSVPKDVELWHQEAKEIVPFIESNLQEGDLVFRLGQTELLGGLIDFSKEVAKATESNFSHAVLVYKKCDDGIIIADITNTGIARRYLIDWYMDGTFNIAVKRLKPEYRKYIPIVLNKMRIQVENDVLYDPKFIANDDKFYCTELVDFVFREAGIPLADKIKIKNFPKYNLLFRFGCPVGGIDVNSEVAVVGNDKIGIFSSDKLELVLDLRKWKSPRLLLGFSTRKEGKWATEHRAS